jgi:TolB protein
MWKKTLAIILFVTIIPSANALVKIDINQGQIDPMPIAMADFSGERETGNKIFKTISGDLEGSGLFKLINKNTFLEQANFLQSPNFSNWRKISATVLITGQVEAVGDDIRVLVKIWDPYSQSLVDGLSYKVKRSAWSRAAHKIADKIYTHLTGEDGYFDSRVVFIMESGSGKKKIKKLAIMDQDGGNVQSLTDGKKLVLTPRFDPSSHRVAYISYSNNIPQVFLYDLATGSKKLVGNFKGMSFAPRFSPDGNYLIMSIAREGTTWIYEVNLKTSTMKMITGIPGTISTSPSYSPDGRHIVFNSDRDNARALYVMNRDGSNINRISFGKGSYTDPVWSPRGDFIAFIKMHQNNFYLGVMRPDGSGERLLTTSWLDEGPTWSPNGRVIMFSREYRNGQNFIHKVDITGYNERKVKTPSTASNPAWSKLLD